MKLVLKKYPTIGACGLDCGLCPRYYTVGSSRCPGCCGPDFFDKHPSCSFVTCCVKEKNFEVCAECFEFPCPKFKNLGKWITSSYPPHEKMIPNLNFIKEHGIKEFVDQQRRRIELLKKMMENFDDGRSRSFYCKAAALLSLTSLKNSLGAASRKVKTGKIEPEDIKSRAKILREILNEFALNEGVALIPKKR